MRSQILKLEISNDEYITEINPNDVICGRGSGPNIHEGNIRFRLLVAEREAEYRATNKRPRKSNIARDIIKKVFERNGRFLKKIEPKNPLCAVNTWVVVNDQIIMEKTKQALRQNRSKTTQSRRLSNTKQDIVSPEKVRSASLCRFQTKGLKPEVISSDAFLGTLKKPLDRQYSVDSMMTYCRSLMMASLQDSFRSNELIDVDDLCLDENINRLRSESDFSELTV